MVQDKGYKHYVLGVAWTIFWVIFTSFFVAIPIKYMSQLLLELFNLNEELKVSLWKVWVVSSAYILLFMIILPYKKTLDTIRKKTITHINSGKVKDSSNIVQNTFNTSEFLTSIRKLGVVPFTDEFLISADVYKSKTELQRELNKLGKWLFNDGVQIVYNPNTNIPCFVRNEDGASKLDNYSVNEFLFLKIMKKYIKRTNDGNYLFINVDELILNCSVQQVNDKPLVELDLYSLL